MGNLNSDKMYFFKFKVSMDGKRYSDFSEVLTVSTVKNQELFFMKKLAQSESAGMTSELPAPRILKGKREKEKDSFMAGSWKKGRQRFPGNRFQKLFTTSLPVRRRRKIQVSDTDRRIFLHR